MTTGLEEFQKNLIVLESKEILLEFINKFRIYRC